MEKHGGVEGHGGGLHGGVLESIKGGVPKCTEGHHRLHAVDVGGNLDKLARFR